MIDGHEMSAGPHLATAIAYYIIGCTLIGIALRVWWMHPVNRAFFFGRYVTEDGLALLLRNWALVFLFGAFIFSCAIEHHLDHLATNGAVDPATLAAVSILEAIISLWTAGSVLWVAIRAAIRTYRDRKGQR